MLKNDLETRKNKIVRNGHRKVGVSSEHVYRLHKVPQRCSELTPTFLWPFLTTLFFRVWSSFFNISHDSQIWSTIQLIRLTWPPPRLQMATIYRCIYSLGDFRKSVDVFWTYSDLPVTISDNFIFSSFELIFQHFSCIRRFGRESSSFAWLGRHPDCRWRPFIAAFTLWGTLGSL